MPLPGLRTERTNMKYESYMPVCVSMPVCMWHRARMHKHIEKLYFLPTIYNLVYLCRRPALYNIIIMASRLDLLHTWCRMLPMALMVRHTPGVRVHGFPFLP